MSYVSSHGGIDRSDNNMILAGTAEQGGSDWHRLKLCHILLGNIDRIWVIAGKIIFW